jgi:hypothetical protein
VLKLGRKCGCEPKAQNVRAGPAQANHQPHVLFLWVGSEQSVWSITKRYRYFALFFVPVVRWNTEWLHLCPVCNHGDAITKQEAEHLLGRQPAAGAPAQVADAGTAQSISRVAYQSRAVGKKVFADGGRSWSHWRKGRPHWDGALLRVEVRPDGSRVEELQEGFKPHCDNGPARVETRADGARIESYYDHGVLQRDPGPAIVETH